MDWEKPRSKTDWLTESEISLLREAFDAGRSACDAACDVNCSTRIVYKHYSRFRGGALAIGRPKLVPQPAQAPVRPSRFYKSNFEL
jgi:hypothetical protein